MSDQKVERRIIAALGVYTLGIALTLLLITPGDGAGVRAGFQRSTLAMNSTRLMYDDGFYYFKIAQQIARGAGSTFDGIHPTNGYHPLWLLCLVPIFRLQAAPDVALIVGGIVQGILMTIGAVLSTQIARMALGWFGASLATLLWIHVQLLYRTPLSGMEYGVQALAIVATLWFYLRAFAVSAPPPRSRTFLALGVLLSVTFLARLETILLAVCIGLTLSLREVRSGLTPKGVRRLLALSLPVAVTVLAYLAVNFRLFGHPLPVSAFIKRDWSQRLLEDDPRYQAHGWIAAKLSYLLWPVGNMKRVYVLFIFAGTLGVASCWLLSAVAGRIAQSSPWLASRWPPRWSSWRLWGGRLPRSSGPFVLFSVLQTSAFVLRYHGGHSFQPWYYVIQPWLGALLLAAVADTAWRWARGPAPSLAWVRRLATLILIAGWCGVPLASARTISQWQHASSSGSADDPFHAAATWVGANVPAGAIVGSWNAGMIGYLSGRQVVNLDGLVNSWDFYSNGRHDLCRYWRDTGVSYLADVFESDREFATMGLQHAPPVDRLRCAAQFDRVWIGPAYPNTEKHAEVFKLRFQAIFDFR